MDQIKLTKNKNIDLSLIYLVGLPLIAVTAMMSMTVLHVYWVVFTLIAIIVAFWK